MCVYPTLLSFYPPRRSFGTIRIDLLVHRLVLLHVVSLEIIILGLIVNQDG